MRAPSHRSPPVHVVSETVNPDLRLRSPYRGIVTGRSILRLRVVIAPRGVTPQEVVVDVDDVAVEGRQDGGQLVLGAGGVDALFWGGRPPRPGLLTWFGGFARRPGRADSLL